MNFSDTIINVQSSEITLKPAYFSVVSFVTVSTASPKMSAVLICLSGTCHFSVTKLFIAVAGHNDETDTPLTIQ